MNPPWMDALVAMPDRESATIALGDAFIAASPAERTTVRAGWPFGVAWKWPSPWRFACTKGEQGTPRQRIVASLLLRTLESRSDHRESILALAVAYNACLLAELNPDAVFSMVASVSPATAAASFTAFIARDPRDKSMEAFGLEKRLNADGEWEIRANW